VKNAENNSVIAAGSSVSFNFIGSKNGQAVPDISEPVETLPPVFTEETSETETSSETEVTDPETDLTENEMTDVETETTEVAAETEITTVTEPVVMPVSEVVFSNYKLTGMVIPMEFDFEIDPEADSDNDGLPDYLEKEIGTDRYNADTDGDGLPDGYEYFTLGTDPAKTDTDDNGISDADEDFDEDGLTNLEEYELGTDPLSKDTDNDGLSDFDEVKTYNTDPLKYDTDGDKVSDGDEIILGLDPNNPATFGYPDNEYTTVQTVGADSSALDYINNIEDNPYSVTIEITAAGVADNNLTAGESGYSYSILQNDAVLGVVPEFDYSDGLSVTDVVIKFKIDDSAVDNELGIYADEPEFNGINRLQVFKYFEDNNILLPIETFYDKETKTVYTHVDELGTYCLMDMEMWINYLENLKPGNYYEEDDEVNSANIAFCLDTRYIADESSFDSVKSDMKAIAEDAFDRYTDVKVYVYHQELGMSLRAKDNLLMDKDGKNYFTSYEEAEAAIDGMAMPKKSVAYDLVHASNYMIDVCDSNCKVEKLDKNIITMYHITNDDKIVGSIDDAKQLIQTVEGSAYTDENDKQAYRINVSVICPNGEVKEGSYMEKLVGASKGIFYSGNTQEVQVQAQVMMLNVAVNNNEQEMTTADTIKENVVEVCGEGYGSDYRVISSIGNDLITLDTPLRENKYYTSKSKKPTDTDGDGIWDWDEVCIEALEELRQDKISDGVIYAKDMPSLLEVMIYYNKHGKGYVGKGFEKYMNENNSNPYSALASLKILPLNSNPADPDSDGDGIVDCIVYLSTDICKNDGRNYYVTEFDDPNPLKFEYLWQWPAIDSSTGEKVKNISSGFEDGRKHRAIDITQGTYDTVVAAYDGEIVAMYYCNCGTDKCLGNYIVIKHLINGNAYYSRYGHLLSFEPDIKNACMNENDVFVSGIKVTAGQKIATMGGTCDYPIHLDFQIGTLKSSYDKVKKISLSNDDLGYVIDPILFNRVYDKYYSPENIIPKKYNMLLNIPNNIKNICGSGSSCNECKEYFDCTKLDSCECKNKNECTCCIKHKYGVDVK